MVCIWVNQASLVCEFFEKSPYLPRYRVVNISFFLRYHRTPADGDWSQPNLQGMRPQHRGTYAMSLLDMKVTMTVVTTPSIFRFFFGMMARLLTVTDPNQTHREWCPNIEEPVLCRRWTSMSLWLELWPHRPFLSYFFDIWPYFGHFQSDLPEFFSRSFKPLPGGSFFAMTRLGHSSAAPVMAKMSV